MSRKKTFDQRSEDEKKEGYTTVNTNMPEGRFQQDKQVLNPDQLGISGTLGADNKTTSTVAAAAKELKSKISIRPDVSVETLEGKQVGGVPLAVGQVTRSVAGASSASPADDASRIPYSSGDYRPSTRYGKKRSEDLFEMDNTICEQVVPGVEDLPDLRSAPDATVGYDGRQQFKQTRGKKNFKFVNAQGHEVPKGPQQLLNDASVDFIHTSKVVYTSGQMIDDAITPESDYPTVDATGDSVAFPMHKGNYMPTALRITVSSGHISAISIDEDKYVVKANPLVRDQANMNAQIDRNNITKTMIRLQTELGRETAEKWSPMGYVIQQPYQFNTLMHDIEASVGAIGSIAYRSAVSSLAFQKNILSKDGINPQRNAIKMILEGYAGDFATTDTASLTDTQFDHMIWNKSEYRKGSAAAIIAMFDSLGKYRTKADLMGLQRSFGLHLSQADNNLNPLHCKPSFIKVLDKAHMFSTPTGSYNPMLPIVATKRIRIMNPLSLNFFLAGWKNPSTLTVEERQDPKRDTATGTYSQYTYRYHDQRNYYTTRVQHPIVEGLLQWLLKHEGAFCATYGEGEAVIPFRFDMQAPSMLSFMICSALQDIVYQRNITFRDILFANEQSTYIWDDLQGLDKLNPLYSSQLSIQKYTDPLKMGKLSADSMLREMWGAHMQLTDEDSSQVQYDMPWYFNEKSFSGATGSYTENEGFYDEEKAFNFSFPSIKDGVRHEYVDIIKSMDPNDVRLAMDRLMDIPVFDEANNIVANIAGVDDVPMWIEHTSVATSSVLNDYVKISALRYEGNSDGRVVVTYNLTSGSNRNLTHHALYLVAKEIGVIDDDYTPVVAMTAAGYVAASGNDPAYVSITGTTLGAELEKGLAPKCKYYAGYSPLNIQSYRVEADGYSAQAIDRSAALTQVSYRCFADPAAITINNNYVAKTGIIPTLGWNDGLNDVLYGVYNLDSLNESTVAVDKQIQSCARRTWTILQRFFLPVDRFANCFTLDNSTHSFDPFEGAFYFGVCGTLAADCTQAVLERLDAYDQLGLDYTEDVNCKHSLIFR